MQPNKIILALTLIPALTSCASIDFDLTHYNQTTRSKSTSDKIIEYNDFLLATFKNEVSIPLDKNDFSGHERIQSVRELLNNKAINLTVSPPDPDLYEHFTNTSKDITREIEKNIYPQAKNNLIKFSESELTRLCEKRFNLEKSIEQVMSEFKKNTFDPTFCPYVLRLEVYYENAKRLRTCAYQRAKNNRNAKKTALFKSDSDYSIRIND